MAPATAVIAPITAHFIWPVMKLPGSTPIPWKNQIPPMIRHTMPRAVITAFISSAFRGGYRPDGRGLVEGAGTTPDGFASGHTDMLRFHSASW